MHTAYLLLGSNLGEKAGLLQRARAQIALQVGRIAAQSMLYESEPWGFESPDWFVNQVLKVETTLLPLPLLALTQGIEKQLGREKTAGAGYVSRAMDIDLLFYDNTIIELPGLVVPHPHVQARRFTLLPLCEIAENLIHPVLHKSIASLLKECDDKGVVRIFPGEIEKTF